MSYRFEEFAGTRDARSAIPCVLIRREGVVSLNQSAYRAIGSPPAVIFLYDRRARVIGLRAAEPEEPHAHRLREQKGTSYAICAAAFLNSFAIPHDELTRFDAVRVENGMLIVELERGTQRRRLAPVSPAAFGRRLAFS